MQEFNGEDQTCNNELGLLFSELLPLFVEVVPQVTAFEVLHDHVAVVLIVKRVVEINDERVNQSGQDIHLFFDSLNASLAV